MGLIRRITLGVVCLAVLAGCGSQNDPMHLFADSDSYDFTANASTAIWHDDSKIIGFGRNGSDSTIYVKPVILYDDYQASDLLSALVTKPGKTEANYKIYGIYQIDINDADAITFKSDLAVQSEGDDASMLFSLSIQDGDQFPVLADSYVEASRPSSMEVDLTEFRGRDKFIILSVESSQATTDSTEAFWINPRILYTFR